jgi:hypothetical protein
MIAVVVALSLVLAPPVEADAAPIEAPVEAEAPVEDAAPADEAVADDASPVDDAAPVDDAPPDPKPVPEDRSVEPHPAVVGNYWDMDRTRGPEPKDGQDEIIAGSILVPLGIIAVSSSAATIWLSAPGHCEARWGSIGADPTADQCKGLRAFGIVRVSYGSLMAVSGAVLLGIGLVRREKHRKWERGETAVAPWSSGRGGGLVWSGRFGFRRM